MSNLVYPSKVKGLTFTSVKTPEFASLKQDAPNGYSLRIPQRKNPMWHFSLVYDYLYQTWRGPNNTQAYAPYTDVDTLMGFFLAMRGQADDFLYFDKTDYCAGGLRSNVWRSGWTYPAGTVIIDNLGYAHLTEAGGTAGTNYPPFTTVQLTAVQDGGILWINQGFFPDGWPNAPAPLSVVTDGLGNYYSPLQRSVGGLFNEDVADLVPGTLAVYSAGTVVNNYTVAGPGLAVPGASYMGLYLQWAGIPASPVTATFQFFFRVRFEEDTQDFENWLKGLWTIGGGNARNGSGTLKLYSSRVARV